MQEFGEFAPAINWKTRTRAFYIKEEKVTINFRLHMKSYRRRHTQKPTQKKANNNAINKLCRAQVQNLLLLHACETLSMIYLIKLLDFYVFCRRRRAPHYIKRIFQFMCRKEHSLCVCVFHCLWFFRCVFAEVTFYCTKLLTAAEHEECSDLFPVNAAAKWVKMRPLKKVTPASPIDFIEWQVNLNSVVGW